MRVLVCGSRTWSDARVVWAALDLLRTDDLVVIEGGALGADSAARAWAAAHGVRHRRFPADWRKFGRDAGPRRNQQMLDEGKPDLVLAFSYEPMTPGTADMVRRARAAGVQVATFPPSDGEGWTGDSVSSR